MPDAYLAAAAMTKFGKYPDRQAAELGREVVLELLSATGLRPDEVDAVFTGRSFAGVLDGQVSIPGQVALAGTGIEDVPVFNLDNACAAMPSALHLATQAVRSGMYETVLVLGTDKLYDRDRKASMAALFGAMDVQANAWMLGEDGTPDGSIFMDNYYAKIARAYLADGGADERDLARVAVKNRGHAALNPFAQYRKPIDEDEVMGSAMVADPLRVLMCSPITDGAAAVLVTSDTVRRRLGASAVRVAASAVRSGRPALGNADPVVTRTSRQAYAEAGLGPEDLDLVELHEAAAVAELMLVEQLGLAGTKGAAGMLRDGDTRLGGRLPVNVSGGLLSRGHPGAATGASSVRITHRA